MTTRRAPGAAQQLALKTLTHLLGSGQIRIVFFAVCTLVTLNWFADSLFELAQWLDGQAPGWWHLGIGLGALPLLVVWLWWLARQARKRLRPHLEEYPDPSRVRGLILYLSVLRESDPEPLQDALAKGIDLENFRRDFATIFWRMPIEAMAYHHSRLDYAVLIPSAVGHDGRSGSVHQAPLFRRLVKQLFPDSKIHTLTIGDLHDAYKMGLDFETGLEELADATDEAYEFLRNKGLQAGDILIDVTGGTKPTSIVGSAMALAEGRRIQYVSTTDYRIRVYDVTYGE